MRADHSQSVAPKLLGARRPYQERYIAPGLGQPRAEIAAGRPGSSDEDPHHSTPHDLEAIDVTGRIIRNVGSSASAVIAAMIHQPSRNASNPASVAVGDATAMNNATPIAIAACRIMLITPDPVANDEGGSAEVLTPIRVGYVSPTPIPVGTIPATASKTLGSVPNMIDRQANAAMKKTMPAVITHAAPNLVIRRPARSNDVTGTSNGPGAMASPALNADQCHAVCSHTAMENSDAPNATE